jgi:hypothetical protein
MNRGVGYCLTETINGKVGYIILNLDQAEEVSSSFSKPNLDLDHKDCSIWQSRHTEPGILVLETQIIISSF